MMKNKYIIVGGELYHYGILGMKWGQHKSKKYAKKAKIARESADEWDEIAEAEMSRGKTKAANKSKKYATKDRADADKYEKRSKELDSSDDSKTARNIKKKRVDQMSNSELKKLNERMNLEQNYRKLNPSVVSKGAKIIAGAAIATTTILTLYNNSNRLIDIGKKILSKGK